MDWIPFAKVTKTHGLRGELKLYPFMTNLELCQEGRHIWLGEDESRTARFQVQSLRGSHASPIIKFDKCDSIEAAKVLCGLTIFVQKKELKKLPKGVYYWFEITGLKVYDEQGQFHGTVMEIIETGSNDVYVVKKGEKEILLPAIEWIVKSIDLKQKKLVFHLVEGLIEETSV